MSRKTNDLTKNQKNALSSVHSFELRRLIWCFNGILDFCYFAYTLNQGQFLNIGETSFN